MTVHTLRRGALMLLLASLPCLVTAAGSCPDSNAKPVRAEQDALDDYSAAYYAPGSYSSWFYVAPPIYDETASAATTQSPPPTALNLPANYDFEPRWGPLFV